MRDYYTEIMGEIRLSWDDHDPFGSVQEWRFAIAEVLAFDCDVWMPEFRTVATDVEPDNHAVESIRWYEPEGIRADDWPHEMWREYTAFIEALQRVLTVLGRYRDFCKLWGRDY